jgi:hypothetical protein
MTDAGQTDIDPFLTTLGSIQLHERTARHWHELKLAGGALGAGKLFGGGFGNPMDDPTSCMTSALLWGAARGRARINGNVARQVAQLLTSGNASRINTACG